MTHDGLTAALPRPVELGMHLVVVRRTSAGAIALTFESDGGVVNEPPAMVRAYRQVYGRDPRGWPPV